MVCEFALIEDILAPLGCGDPRALSFSDDAALMPQLTGDDIVVTTDTMVAGIHFPADELPDLIARRLLRVNLSDLAAMAAQPDSYFLNLVLPPGTDDAWMQTFASGLRQDQDRFELRLLGGDITHTRDSLVVSVTALGKVPEGRAVTRSGAAPGDLVMVSGLIGDAALGLKARLESLPWEEQVARYQLPEPRIQLGLALRCVASAMADVSDGLVADLGHVCKASDVHANIEAASIPLSEQATELLARGDVDLAALITGGDDYELVFAVPPGRKESALDAGRRAGVSIREIGWFEPGEAGVRVTDPSGSSLAIECPGYRHF